MKKIAVYPGSFDPATYGHFDIIARSSKIFDKLIVAVISNPNKKPLFSISERVKILSDTIKEKNVDPVRDTVSRCDISNRVNDKNLNGLTFSRIFPDVGCTNPNIKFNNSLLLFLFTSVSGISQ